MITIVVIGGLPASGKTTLANEYKNKKVFRMDDYRDCSEKEIKLKIRMFFADFHDRFKRDTNYSQCKFIVEGLFTTNDDVKKLLEYIEGNSSFDIVSKVEIVWFKEDRLQCIVNDTYRLRRHKKSTKTILNLPYEPIDLSLYKDYRFKFNLIEKDVYAMEDWQKFAKKFDINLTTRPRYYYTENAGEERFLVGYDTWEKYGTRNNCWGHVRDVEMEEPTEFTELNDLLEKVVPNITFLQYKKLDCVVFDEDIDIGDYYSSVTGGCNVCDIKDLYERLVELELFDPETLKEDSEENSEQLG
jgi:hypothetical protein